VITTNGTHQSNDHEPLVQ